MDKLDKLLEKYPNNHDELLAYLCLKEQEHEKTKSKSCSEFDKK